MKHICLLLFFAGVALAQEADTSKALLSTAFDFMARASSTSEVLTLNLTNLLILLGLKALIFAFGLFSGGTGTSYSSYSRSADSGKTGLLSQADLTGGMCFMMYASGDEEKLSCVQRSACEDPQTATDYLTAAKMWYKIHKLMRVVPFNEGYHNVMNAVQEAAEQSLYGGDCTVYKW